MSRERRPEEQVLAALLCEMRELPAPELDWERIERRLLNEQRTATPLAGFFLRFRLAAVVLIAASAVALYVFAQHHPAARRATPIARIANTPLNGDTLALGSQLAAGNQSLVVEHVGRARWTLFPHAIARLVNTGEFLTVRLESGVLTASVTPSKRAETFAIEVGGTRVAVHGTVFRVERADDRVLVEVTEGVVAVEPAATRSDPSFLLRRGSRGSFGLDGRSGTVEGNASVVVRDTRGQSLRQITRSQPLPPPPAAHPVAAAPSAANEPQAAPLLAALPEQPSISDIERGVSAAVSLMTSCFRDKTQSSSTVSASTGMTLSVGPNGNVRSVTFQPPLAPAVEDCGVTGLRNLTFAPSAEGVTFTRVLELQRP